ncbi:MAG TPA: hypothetical protein VHA13_05710 [Gammaproteobacteria bacterium]|nr:hypothetical protein [Gammaproteobacteria bacterium]
MSSTRLVISNELLEALKQLHQAAIVFEKEHTTDGLYYTKLLKPLREQENDPRLDYSAELLNDLVIINHCKSEVESLPNHVEFQVGMAGAVQNPLSRLLEKIALFEKIPQINSEQQKACKDAKSELQSVDASAKQLLLSGYKNKLYDLAKMLKGIEDSTKQYKQEHQNDHLYQEALAEPLKQACTELLKQTLAEPLKEAFAELLKQANFDFVTDLVKNCDSIRSHVTDFEDKSTEDASSQLACIKELTAPVHRLFHEISLFKKAPQISEIEQKTCEVAIKDLEKLKTFTEKLFTPKPT